LIKKLAHICKEFVRMPWLGYQLDKRLCQVYNKEAVIVCCPMRREERAEFMESEQFRWIGKPLPRVEDERLMRGAGHYIDDIEPLPGCKVAAILRSPYAHAFILHIDVADALRVPGVVVLLPGPTCGAR